MPNDVVITVSAQDRASATFGAVHKSASGMGSKLASAGKIAAVGIAGIAGAAAGAGLASIKMAMDFEKSFSEVKTLLPDMDKEGFGVLRKGLTDLSKQMGIAINENIPALYQAISAGVPADNVMDFMRIASKAAIGGVTDLETAVDGMTSVINAYGKEAISAQKAADIMFTGVKLGKTDFAQLSQSLFNVIPTAASLGVSFEEVTASLATMTAQGVPTAVATTQLRQALVEASKGGTELDKAIRKLHGVGFSDLVKSGRTATAIFDDLRKSMPEQQFRDLFGSVEAMNAVLQITGDNLETQMAAMDAMGASAGAVDKAFATVSETAGFKFNKAMNSLKLTMIDFGSKALPTVVILADALSKGLDAASPAVERFIHVLSAGFANTDVEGGASRMELAFFKVGQAVRSVADFIQAEVLPRISAFVASAIPQFQELGRIVQAEFQKFMIYYRSDIKPAMDNVIIAATALVEWFEANWPKIEQVVRPIMDAILAIVKLAIDLIGAHIGIGLDLIQGDWAGAWNRIKGIVSETWETIKTIASLALEALVALVVNAGPELLKAAEALALEAAKGLGQLREHGPAAIRDALFFVLEQIAGLAGAFLEWGIQLGVNVGKGILKGVKDTAGDVVGFLNPLDSPPGFHEMGEKYRTWGASLGTNIAEGMAEALPEAFAGAGVLDSLRGLEFGLNEQMRLLRIQMNEMKLAGGSTDELSKALDVLSTKLALARDQMEPLIVKEKEMEATQKAISKAVEKMNNDFAEAWAKFAEVVAKNQAKVAEATAAIADAWLKGGQAAVDAKRAEMMDLDRLWDMEVARAREAGIELTDANRRTWEQIHKDTVGLAARSAMEASMLMARVLNTVAPGGVGAAIGDIEDLITALLRAGIPVPSGLTPGGLAALVPPGGIPSPGPPNNSGLPLPMLPTPGFTGIQSAGVTIVNNIRLGSRELRAVVADAYFAAQRTGAIPA